MMLLVIGETLEIIIPLAYMACFMAAYMGPNAEILGNVKNGFWQYKSVEDPMNPIQNLLILVIFDSIMFLGVTVILYFCYHVNLFYVYIFIMKEYGPIFSIHIAYLMDQLFCMVAVACALDFTFQFDWWLHPEKWQNRTGITFEA